MQTLTIGIVGNGTIGSATGEAFPGHTKKKWDINERRSPDPLEDVFKADIIFLCLPTPAYYDGSCDLSALIGFFAQLSSAQKKLPFVLRSTVPVGTTKHFKDLYGIENMVYSPAFLTGRTAVADAMNPRALYIGVPGYDSAVRHDTGKRLYELYEQQFVGLDLSDFVVGPSCEIEAIKLFTNAFFAAKVSIFNEFKALVDARQLNWDMVVSGMLADKRIHPLHTKVPGPDGQPGFGGACFPKDIQSVVSQMWKAMTPHNTLLGAITTNNKIQRD